MIVLRPILAALALALLAGALPAQEVAQAAATSPSALMQAQTTAEAFRETLAHRLEAWPVSVNEVLFILRATSPDGRIATFAEALLWSLALFAVGMLVEKHVFGKRIARRFVVSRVREDPQGYSEKMPFLVFRFFMGVLGALVSMLVAYLLGLALFAPVEDAALRYTIAVIYATYFACRLVSGIWRMVLSPFLGQYRIPRLSDHEAKRLFRWLWILATLDIAALSFSTWIADFGLNYDVYALLYAGLTGLLAIGHILMVLFNRRAITGAVLNGRPPEEASLVLRALAALWAPLLIGYVLFSWVELAVDLVLEQPTSIPLIVAAYGVVLSILVVYGVINYFIERAFARRRARFRPAPPEEEGALAPVGRGPARMETFEDLARRVSGILAFVAGVYALLRFWNADSMGMTPEVLESGLDIVAMLFLAYVVYHAFRIWIDGKIAEETVDMPVAEPGDEGGGASAASRLATLLPLFRNFILIVVVVTFALIALLELGINVSPLFAGAGVVGLAVGFGAQTLVRDIFSGAFFLIDDAFRKGEYIDVGEVKGTVEKISVRSFQLRHHLGALHTIPFGEITRLTNFSRDWVIMKLPLRVTYDTDVERVRKLIKRLGQDLLSDPVIGEAFLSPVKSQGVIEMQDSAMIIRVKFMTKPGEQWLVRKRVYQEIRDLFEREGIRFAHREVTVRLADEAESRLTPREREAVAGAVEAAIAPEALQPGLRRLEDG